MSTRLPDGRAQCTHLPEAHIVYDRLTRRYFAKVYCHCGEVMVRGRSRYEAVKDAEGAARALLKLTMENVLQ